MKHIRIISGTYGYRAPDTGRVAAKRPSDPPFAVPAAEADRLVALGVAAHIFGGDSGAAAAALGGGAGDAPSDTEAAQEGMEIPAYSTDLSANTLREIAKTFGVALGAGLTKAEMVAELDAYFADLEELEAVDGTDAPDLGIEGPVE